MITSQPVFSSIIRMYKIRMLLLFSSALPIHSVTAAISRNEVEAALQQAVGYFRTTSRHGGYGYFISADQSQRWGERLLDENAIEVQPPGTPAVGLAFLRIYRASGDEDALQAAKDAATALILGQNELGGWGHTIQFGEPKSETVSFDDDQTQTAISFLIAMREEASWSALETSLNRALDMMLVSQLENGGWPHRYPPSGNYHDYATFNDQGINDCIRVVLEAHAASGDTKYQESLEKAGRFLVVSQLPPPQPGWAQQYNEYLQPAWARTFEPPSVCPSVTLHNVHSLLDLYRYTGNDSYLEPIPDALRWLRDIRLKNGKWARFVEISTGKPLYYDRGRIRVDSTDELSLERRTGYGYEVDLQDRLESTETRFRKVVAGEPEAVPRSLEQIEDALDAESASVARIIAAQDEVGRWVNKDERYKDYPRDRPWSGEYAVSDQVSSRVFIGNTGALCAYLGLLDQFNEFRAR